MNNNFNQLMKQAQKMQEKIKEAQSKMYEITVDGSAGGGMVTISLDGKNDIRGLKIDPKLMNPDEVDIVADLVIAAYKDAKSKLESKMSEQLGGLLPPGMNLPF